MQTDSSTELFAWHYSPWVCWSCTHPPGYSDALHHNGSSDYSSAAVRSVSSVTCMKSTAFSPQLAEDHRDAHASMKSLCLSLQGLLK